MPKKRSPRRKQWKAQRAIVLQLLREDHGRLWTREELRDEIPDVSRHMFDLAIELLEDDACIALDADEVYASTPVRHLDELDLWHPYRKRRYVARGLSKLRTDEDTLKRSDDGIPWDIPVF